MQHHGWQQDFTRTHLALDNQHLGQLRGHSTQQACGDRAGVRSARDINLQIRIRPCEGNWGQTQLWDAAGPGDIRWDWAWRSPWLASQSYGEMKTMGRSLRS